VLFEQRFWPGIADGSITVAFRRWRRPSVRAGGRLRSPAGELAIETVDVIEETAISESDARRAGYPSRDALLRQLNSREGTLHRIAFHLAGPDSRIALRERTDLTPEEVEAIEARLERMDRGDEWTLRTLRLIGVRPGTRAADLASTMGSETPPFKARIRRLKELGLTESLDVGTGFRREERPCSRDWQEAASTSHNPWKTEASHVHPHRAHHQHQRPARARLGRHDRRRALA